MHWNGIFLLYLSSTICLEAQIGLQQPTVELHRLSTTVLESSPRNMFAVYSENHLQFQSLPRSASQYFEIPDMATDHTPFFCALEDKIRQKSGLLCKFRLGSVQYVDALEGKSYFQAVPNSQTTQKQMAVRRRQ